MFSINYFRKKKLGLQLPLFALVTTDSKYLDTSFAARLFCKLELSSFSEAELRRAFERTASGGTGKLSREEIRAMLLHEEQGRICPCMLDSQVEATTAHLLSSAPSGLLSFGEFKEKITALAERRDPRIWPIAASMLLSGTAVGVVLPVMPIGASALLDGAPEAKWPPLAGLVPI